MTLWLILILVASALAPLFWFRDFFSRLTFSENADILGRELRTLIPAGTPARKALSLLKRNGFETETGAQDEIRGRRIWRKSDGSSWKIEVMLTVQDRRVSGSRVSIQRDPR